MDDTSSLQPRVFMVAYLCLISWVLGSHWDYENFFGNSNLKMVMLLARKILVNEVKILRWKEELNSGPSAWKWAALPSVPKQRVVGVGYCFID